jgi:WD40-like Beta Propeller Repeat
MHAGLIICLFCLLLAACEQARTPISSATTARPSFPIASSQGLLPFATPSPFLVLTSTTTPNLSSATWLPSASTPTSSQTRNPTRTSTPEYWSTRDVIRATEQAIIPNCGLAVGDTHSPDGKWVAVGCINNFTAVYNLEDSSILWVVGFGQDLGLYNPELEFFGQIRIEFWSLDSRYVYLTPFHSGGEGGCPAYLDGVALLRLDVITGEVTFTIRPEQYPSFYNISFSPDGTQLAYFRTWLEHPILNIQNLTTGEERHIPLGERFDEAGDVIWSPDKSRIAFSARTGYLCSEMVSYLVIMDMDDLDQTILLEAPFRTIKPLNWTEDENIIFAWGYQDYYGSINVNTGVITPYQVRVTVTP